VAEVKVDLDVVVWTKKPKTVILLLMSKKLLVCADVSDVTCVNL